MLSPIRIPLPVEELVPDGVPTPGAVTLDVEPVGLGHFFTRAAFSDGTRPMIAARVMTSPPVNGKWSLAPDIEPKLVGTQNRPRFEARTVPTLPYGAFFIQVTNNEKRAVFLSPKQLTLVLGGKRIAAADEDAAKNLWSATISAYPKDRIGTPWIDVELQTVHGALPIFDKEIEIAPNSTWRGFALFDVGTYTADEYNAALALNGKVDLVLSVEDKSIAKTSFRATKAKLPAVCLPATNHASEERCEVLIPSSRLPAP